MKKFMMAIVALLATATFVCSCQDTAEEMHSNSWQSVEKKQRSDSTVVVNNDKDIFVVVDDENFELSTAYLYEVVKGDTSFVTSQLLRRRVNTVDLGRHQGSQSNWHVDGLGNLTSGESFTESGNTYCTVTTSVTVYSDTITNGVLDLQSKYELVQETCTFSYKDTTIVVQPRAWEVKELSTSCSNNVVTNVIEVTYGAFKTTAREKAELWQEEAASGRQFVGAKFAATINSAKGWLVGGALRFNDGVATIAITPDLQKIDGSVVFWGGINDEALNSCFYVERQKKYYPVIASDQNSFMEWSTCGQQNGTLLGKLSYADADQYANFAFGATQENGQHSAMVKGFSVKDDANDQILTICYNGRTICRVNYGEF